MKQSIGLIWQIRQPKERRSLPLNVFVLLLFLAVGFGLVQLGLSEGRADPAAPFPVGSADLQTLIASAFIGLAVVMLISSLRLGWFTFKRLADKAQGPAMLLGYVTTREIESGQSSFGREQTSYRLYLVPSQAFPLWLQGSGLPEDALAMHWMAKDLPTVLPRIFQVPDWIYAIVREGDLIRLYYARWQRIVLKAEIVENISLPQPSKPNTSSASFPAEAEIAQWRVVEIEPEP